MEIINREGKELEVILDNICSEYNIQRNDFYYNYKEMKSGLFNKNSNYSVNVILKSDLVIYVKEYLEELLKNMGLTCNFETKLREDSIYIKIYSSNNPVLIGKGGNTLKSLETIVKQKINTDFNIRPYICLDVENYREKQQKRIERLAKNMAREVRKTKVLVHLENMSAYDRRIVHNILSDFDGVKTVSEGEEPNRHVVIKPE